MRIVTLILPIAILCAGCDRLAQLPMVGGLFTPSLQCHGENEVANVVQVLRKDALKRASGDSETTANIEMLVSTGAPEVTGTVERKRKDNGGVECSGQFSMDMKNSAIKPADFHDKIQLVVQNNRQYQRLLHQPLAGADVYEQAQFVRPDLIDGSRVQWNIDYTIEPTSDHKQTMVSVDNGKDISLFLLLNAALTPVDAPPGSAKADPKVDTHDVTVSCGALKATASGFEQSDGYLYETDHSKLVITGGDAGTRDLPFNNNQRPEAPSFGTGTKMACIDAEGGKYKYLLIGTSCSYGCYGGFIFFLFDVGSGALISPNGGQDKKSLEQLIGQEIDPSWNSAGMIR